MDNDIAVIDQDPAVSRLTLDCTRPDRDILPLPDDVVRERAQLRLTFTIAQQKVICEDRLLPNIQQQNIIPLLVDNGVNEEMG